MTITGVGAATGTLAGASDNVGVLVTDGGLIETASAGSATANPGRSSSPGPAGPATPGTPASPSPWPPPIRAFGGAVTVTGVGRGTGADNRGVNVQDGSSIEAGNAGTLALTGTAGGTGVEDVRIDGPLATVRTDAGDVTITGLRNDVAMTGGGRVLSNAGDAALRAAGNVLLGAVNLDADGATTPGAGAAFVTADANTAALDATGVASDGAGAILDNLVGEAPNLTAASAVLRAGSGIGTDADDLNAATVSDAGATFTLAALTDSGDVHLTNAGDLAVATVDGLSGVTIADDAALGGDPQDSGQDNVTLAAVGGSLTLNEAVANLDGGAIALAAAGNVIQANAHVATLGNAGDVTLTADRVDLNAPAAAALVTPGGTFANVATLQSDGGAILFAAPGSAAVLQADATLDTDFAGLRDAGAVDLANAALSAEVAGLDLLIDTSAGADPATAGGAVALGVIADGGAGAFLRDVTVATSDVVAADGTAEPCAAGALDLHGAVTLTGAFAATAGDVTFLNAANSRLATAASLTAAVVAVDGRDVRLEADTTIATAGAGTIDLLACRTIALDDGAAITAVDGDVILDAGRAPAPGDSFTAVTIGDATGGAAVRTTGDGDLFISGVGASDGGTSGRVGVLLQNGAVIAAAGTGDVTVTGTGGAGMSFNVGVRATDALGLGTTISATTGSLTVTGAGGVGAATPGRGNHGVQLAGGAAFVTDSGALTVQGAGAAGTRDNDGVNLFRDGSAIRSADGDVTVTGVAAAGGTLAGTDGSEGVALFGRALIGGTTGAVTVTGTGGGGENGNVGVLLAGQSAGPDAARIVGAGVGEAVRVTGTGGASASAVAANNSVGVRLVGGASIAHTGAAFVPSATDPAAVIVTGTGADGGSGNDGVAVDGSGSVISAAAGGVRVTGIGNGAGQNNRGVELTGGGTVEAAAGLVDVTGLGGGGVGSVGVLAQSGGTIRNTGAGDVTVRGDVTDAAAVDGVRVDSGAISTADGEVLLDADFTDPASGLNGSGGSDALGTLAVLGTGTVAAGAEHDLTVVAADVNFAPTASLAAAGDTIFLNNSTANRLIRLGTGGLGGGAGDFNLTDAEADRLNAAVLEIGSATRAAGDVTVGGLSLGTIVGGAGNADGTLLIRTAGDVVEDGTSDAAADLSQITNLALLAGGRVGGATDAIGDRLEIDAQTLAVTGFAGGDAARAGGSVRLADTAGSLAVGAVTVPSGASAAGVRAAGELELLAAGSLTVENTTAAEDLRGSTLAAVGGANLTVRAGAAVRTAGGDAVLRADGGTLTLGEAASLVTFGGDAGLAAGGDLTMAPTSFVDVTDGAAAGNVVLRAGGDLALSRVNAGDADGGGAVGLSAGGAIRDVLAGDGPTNLNLSGSRLAVRAGAGVGNADALDVSVTELAAQSAAGDVRITNHNAPETVVTAVTAPGVDAVGQNVAGVSATGASAGGTAELIAADGDLTVNEVVAGGARVALAAAGGVTLNADLRSDPATGSVAVLAADGDVLQPGADLIRAGSVALQASGSVGAASFSNPGRVDAINLDAATVAARGESLTGEGNGVGLAQRGGRTLTVGAAVGASLAGGPGATLVGATAGAGTVSLFTAGGVRITQAIGDENPFNGASNVTNVTAAARGEVLFTGAGRLTTRTGQAVAPLPGTLIPVTGNPPGTFVVGQTGEILAAGDGDPVDLAVRAGTRRGGIADENVTVVLTLPGGQLSPTRLAPGQGGTIFNFGPQTLGADGGPSLIDLANQAAANGGVLPGGFSAAFDPSIRLSGVLPGGGAGDLGGADLGATNLAIGGLALTFAFGDVVAADPLPDPDPEAPPPPDAPPPLPPAQVFVVPPTFTELDESAPASSAPASDLPELQLWVYADQEGLVDGVDEPGDPDEILEDLPYYLIGDPFRSAYLSLPYFRNAGAEGRIYQFVIVFPGQGPQVESAFMVAGDGTDVAVFDRAPAGDLLDDGPTAPVGPRGLAEQDGSFGREARANEPLIRPGAGANRTEAPGTDAPGADAADAEQATGADAASADATGADDAPGEPVSLNDADPHGETESGGETDANRAHAGAGAAAALLAGGPLRSRAASRWRQRRDAAVRQMSRLARERTDGAVVRAGGGSAAPGSAVPDRGELADGSVPPTLARSARLARRLSRAAR